MSVNENETEYNKGKSLGSMVNSVDPQKVAEIKQRIQLSRHEIGTPFRDLILDRLGKALRKIQATAAQGSGQQNTPPPLTLEQEEYALRERLEALEKQKLENARQHISIET